MRLTFIGADHEVTGSMHVIEACGLKILLDCGMEQGFDAYVNAELPFSPADIDYIFLSHAHIDHTGMIPLMYARGFRGKVFATEATVSLCNIMLRDSAHIQEFEAEWRNRKGKRAGEDTYVPLYTMNDAIGALEKFVPCPYEKEIVIYDQGMSDGVVNAPDKDHVIIRFKDVGHLLGSASIEIWIREGEEEKKIVFSGDIGNLDQPIIKDPNYIEEGDIVIMESTYGDRSHGGRPDYIKELASIIQETFDKGGNVVIPSFAVGRTQEMLYFIRQIKQEKLIKNHDNFEVYVDSPLAVEATTIFNQSVDCCFDEEAMELVKRGINPIAFPNLKTAVSSDESRNINFNPAPKVIISASGMCEAGRIRHHLKHNLWRKESTILFVGYQANGTLGRAIVEGAQTVKLFGEEITVNARIAQLAGISGHADKDGLIKWVSAIKNPEKVYVVHGEDSVCENFVAELRDMYHIDAYAPYTGESFDLVTGERLTTGNKEKRSIMSAKARHSSTVFGRLVAAGERLMAVIRHNEGGTNKDLAKFTDQIIALCDKWDR